MNVLDWIVLLGTMLAIAAYGIWRTRGRRDLSHFLKGDGRSGWITIGLTVMATQASAVTFISMPGQGYRDGLTFVQNYFGAPFAMIIIAAVFLPIYRKLNIYTAYEYLGRRFDTKTRLLGAALFLFQRGIAAGITIYAPAIVLSTVFGWSLSWTIVLSGAVVTLYTVAGGSEAVTLTQKYQFAVITVGMIAAFVVLVAKLPDAMTFTDGLVLAGASKKLTAVDFSVDPNLRYTVWSGILGGMFLALSYFGTDQTQVQRYIGGASLRESRLGLMFNAVLKIPMQFFILLLGVMLFVFYHFEPPPLFFNQVEWQRVARVDGGASFGTLEEQHRRLHVAREQQLRQWLDARHAGQADAAAQALATASTTSAEMESVRNQAKAAMTGADKSAKTNDADYIFISFILRHLPHGMIGLLVAVFFAATLASKGGELNALASTTVVDFYRHLIAPNQSDRHYVIASKAFTAFWGVVAVCFALFVRLVENLIQAGNIVASLFYGVILGLFVAGFCIPWLRGTAVFTAALAAQTLVLVLYFTTPIGYLWYNVIGPTACIVFAVLLQATLRSGPAVPAEENGGTT